MKACSSPRRGGTLASELKLVLACRRALLEVSFLVRMMRLFERLGWQ